MPTLVTGGTGFIGARVVRSLVASGDKVVCFDISPSVATLADLSGEVKVLQGDVTCIEDIIGAIQRHGIDRIVHLAVQRERLHPAMRISALGTNCVFEAARLTGVKRVAFASSVAYHGSQASFGERPVTEEDHGFPTIVYGAIKWINEFMANAYNAQYGMEIIALRIALVYGWASRGGLNWANDIVAMPATGKPAVIPCRSSQRACLIHMDDVAEIFTRLVRNETLSHRVYHTGGYTCPLEEVAGLVKEFIPEAQISFDEQAAELPFVYLIDNRRMLQELGVPLRDLREGILHVMSAVRARAGLAPAG